jgi:signal transduction histidine kinase
LPQQPHGPSAVYLPWFPRGQVYVNGVLVGEYVRAPGTAFYPQLFDVPPNQFHAASNVIHLHAQVPPSGYFTLYPLAAGDARALREEHRSRTWLQNLGVQMFCVVLLALGLSTLAIWLRRRSETAYGYFGIQQLGTALFVSHFFVQSPPLPAPYWWLLHNSMVLCNFLMSFFALRYAGWRWPRIEKLLWIAIIATPIVYGANTFGHLTDGVTDAWEYFAVAALLIYVGIFIAHARRHPTLGNVLLAVVSPSVFLSVVPAEFFFDQYPDVVNLYLSYQFLPLCLVVSWILLDRFISTLNEAEALNRDLEQRVQQKQAELQSNFQRLQLLEREQTIAEERSRIMSDMHDGIGAQLISTIGLAEHGRLSQQEMATAMRECLDDLRLTIDSLEPTDNDLLPALGNFRYRVDPRLQRQGIALDWCVTDLPRLACLTPRNLLHVLRILQEAFTNVLKHAHASMIRVETGLREGGQQVFIRVSDNGAGFQGDHRGRGLANMQQRAERIGGVLQIQPSGQGTTLELRLPVALAAGTA